MQVSLKKAILHMEKCFMKVSQSVCVLCFEHLYSQLEGNVSFGGVVKNEG